MLLNFCCLPRGFILLVFLFYTRIVNGILGGEEISITEAPYQVNYGDVCGAVLLNKKWAVTTAHCGTGIQYVRVGSNRRLKGAEVKISSHFVHPKYQRMHEFDYDIQLLELNRPLRLNNKVAGIAISDGYSGESIYVTGWGYPKEKSQYNDLLQRVKLPIVPIDQCQKVNESWYNHTLSRRMFCAGGEAEDACQGDSGGAAVSHGRLVGISSFGFGCGRRIPGVYINVTEHNVREWIKEYTGY